MGLYNFSQRIDKHLDVYLDVYKFRAHSDILRIALDNSS